MDFYRINYGHLSKQILEEDIELKVLVMVGVITIVCDIKQSQTKVFISEKTDFIS